MPGIVESRHTLRSARASGPRSWSSGAIRASRMSITSSASATERRQTSGIPRDSSSSSTSAWRNRASGILSPHWVSRPKVLGRGPQAHQVQAALQPLGQGALLERRDPERRHELAPAELSEHARVDLVGLASERRDVLDLARVGLNVPARLGEPVAHPDRAAHHLQAGPHLGPQLEHEPREPVLVGRHEPLTGDRPVGLLRAPRRASIRPVDSDILHPGLLASDCVTKRQFVGAWGPSVHRIRVTRVGYAATSPLSQWTRCRRPRAAINSRVAVATGLPVAYTNLLKTAL